MAREWKPGDVAFRRARSGDEYRTIVVADCKHKLHVRGPHWHHQTGGWDHLTLGPKYHPLVVIDPEDREQVSILARTLGRLIVDIVTTNDVQAALRSLIEPPKPPEPGAWSVAVVADNTPFMRVAESHITPPLDECWFGEHPQTGERVRLSWTALHALGDVRVVNDADVTS